MDVASDPSSTYVPQKKYLCWFLVSGLLLVFQQFTIIQIPPVCPVVKPVLNPSLSQEKPLSRSLQRGEDAQFDQVSPATAMTRGWNLYHMWMYGCITIIFQQQEALSLPPLYVCAVFESPAPPNQSPTQWPVCPSSVAAAELYTMGLPAAECFVQHNTKPMRIWRYRSSCPHCEWGRENGYRKRECRIAVSSWAVNQHRVLECICLVP